MSASRAGHLGVMVYDLGGMPPLFSPQAHQAGLRTRRWFAESNSPDSGITNIVAISLSHRAAKIRTLGSVLNQQSMPNFSEMAWAVYASASTQVYEANVVSRRTGGKRTVIRYVCSSTPEYGPP